MKLTTEEIQNIDEYLQRSGVTYWDVRMELLDHFIEAIEEKIATTELSFDEALMEVTVAFGNDIQERYLLNRDRTGVIASGIFSNNKGFRELEEEKRKQNKKKYIKLLREQLKHNFMSTHFYADYLSFALVLYISFQYYIDWIFLVITIWLGYEILRTMYTTRKYKFTQYSLRGEMSSKVLSVFFSLTINPLMMMYINTKLKVNYIFWVVICMLLLYPIMKAGISIHKIIYNQYKKYHELISVE